MYLLYVDDSGSINDPAISHFVLSGTAVFERQGYWIARELDKIASRFDEADPDAVELHGNPMVQGNKGWRAFSRESRTEAIRDALRAFDQTHHQNRIFTVVLEKGSVHAGDPVEFAFEHLCNRFDRFLGRLHRQGNTQRGLMVMDESAYEHRFQGLARDFSSLGHRWGVLRNLAEVPLFADSKATRLLQLADLVAYSIFRHYEKGDSQFFDLLKHRFDSEGDQCHGLVHWRRAMRPTAPVLPPPIEEI